MSEDILERAKSLRHYLANKAEWKDESVIVGELISEVERLRSDQDAIMAAWDKDAVEHDARIKALEANNKRLEAAFLEAKRCPTCNGAGKLIDVVISRNLGRVESERVCPLCEGKWEEKAREALEEIKTGGAMSNSVDICPFDDDLTCPLDYHTCEIYRERMEEEQ